MNTFTVTIKTQQCIDSSMCNQNSAMESRDSHSLSRGVACKNVKFFKNVARPVMRMIFKLHYRMVACTTACFANGMHIDYAQIRVLDGLFQSVAFERLVIGESRKKEERSRTGEEGECSREG
jgi:hypothetical protein